MKKDFVDLHTHSTASDGKYSPTEIIAIAKEKGLKAVALTDHETIAGLDEFLEAGAKEGIEAIPGVELETHEKELGFSEVHIVGLFIDKDNEKFKELLAKSSKQRIIRNKAMIEKISKLGYNISFKEVEEIADKQVGRPHITKVLMKNHPEEFESISDVFRKLLVPGTPGFVEREEIINFKDAVDVIHAAGGVAIFAHPFFFEKWREITKYFAEVGGDGIETMATYPKEGSWNGLNLQKKVDSEFLTEMMFIVKEKNLLESGGTDFHGTKEWELPLGGLNIPYSFVEKIKKVI